MSTVLIGILVKNAKNCLDNLFREVENLDYPKSLLSIGIVESDSEDGSYEYLKDRLVPALRGNGYARVELLKHDFGFPLNPHLRHRGEHFNQRCKNIGDSRNLIIEKMLKDEQYLWWVDADFQEIPPNILKKLLTYDKDIVVPPLYMPNGKLFDTMTKVGDKTLDHFLGKQSDPLLPVTYVGEPSLIHRRVLDAGVRYQQTEKYGITGDYFSEQAGEKGFKLYAALDCRIVHHAMDGLSGAGWGWLWNEDLPEWHHEKHIRERFEVWTEKDTFIDVGAHAGIWVLSLAHVFKKIFCIEPYFPTCSILSENLSLNRVNHAEIMNFAVGREDGEGLLSVRSEWMANHLEQHPCSLSGLAPVVEKVPVKVRSLDSLFLEYSDKIDFIKIDVEGLEMDVLQGAWELIKKHNPILVVEAHSKTSREDVITLLGREPTFEESPNPDLRFPDIRVLIFSPA